MHQFNFLLDNNHNTYNYNIQLQKIFRKTSMRHQFVRSPLQQQQHQMEQNSRNSLPRDDINHKMAPNSQHTNMAQQTADFMQKMTPNMSNRKFSPNKTAVAANNRHYIPTNQHKSAWDGRQSVPTILNESGQQILPGGRIGNIPDGRKSVPPQAEYRSQPAAHEHQRSMSPADISSRPKLPPPTAPKPKTPVHFNHQQPAVPEPIRRNATVHDFSEALHQYNENQQTKHQYNQQSYQSHQQYSPDQHGRHFLDGSLPPTNNQESIQGRHQPPSNVSPTQAKTQTLPARIKYTEHSPRNAANISFDQDLESPRTSKSGLQNPATPVPPSPRDTAALEPSPRNVGPPPEYQNPPASGVSSLNVSDSSLQQRQNESGIFFIFPPFPPTYNYYIN